MKYPNERLRWARSRADIPTATEAAARFGIPAGTYAGHENGSRAFGPDEAMFYAKKLRVTAGWLMFGEGAPSGKDRPLTAMENEILEIYRRIPEDQHPRVVAALELGATQSSLEVPEENADPPHSSDKPSP